MAVGLLIPPLVLSTPPVSGAHNSRWQRGTARYNGQNHSLFILMKDPHHPFSFTLTTAGFAHLGLWLGLWSFSYRTLSLHFVCSSTVSVKSSQGNSHHWAFRAKKQMGPGQREKLRESTLSLLGNPCSVQGEFHSTTVTTITAIYNMN